MLRLNNYLGFSEIMKNVSPESNPAKEFVNKLMLSDVEELIPYFRKSFTNFIKETFPEYDMTIKYHIVNIDGVKLWGLSLRNIDIEGLEEFYIVKINSFSDISLIGIPTPINKTDLIISDVSKSKTPFVLDMNINTNRVDNTSSMFKRSFLNKNKSYRGLSVLIKFSCDVLKNENYDKIYCDGKVTLSTDSIFGVLKQCEAESSTMFDTLLQRLKATYVEQAMFENISNYLAMSQRDYLTMWYSVTERLTFNEARERSNNHIETLGIPEDYICIQTENDAVSTLYYNESEKKYFLSDLSDMENKVLVVMLDDKFISRDYYTVETYEDEERLVLASEGMLCSYKKKSNIYGKSGIYMEADIDDLTNKSMEKENPQDKTKIEAMRKQAEATISAMDGMGPDAAEAHFKTKVVPMIKTALGLAYTVGYIVQPMAFGLVSFLALAILSKDGLDRAGDKMKAIDMALTEYLTKVKGKTDVKSTAFASNIEALRNKISKAVKNKKDDKVIEESTKELVQESALWSRLIKTDLLLDLQGEAPKIAEQLIQESVSIESNDSSFIKSRISDYSKLLIAHNVDPDTSSMNKPTLIIRTIMGIAAMYTCCFALASSSIVGFMVVIGGMIMMRVNGRSATQMFIEFLDIFTIYIAEPDSNSAAFKKAKDKASTLSKEEIELLDRYREKLQGDKDSRDKAKQNINKLVDKLKKIDKETESLAKESFSIQTHQLVMDSQYNIGFIDRQPFNSMEAVMTLDEFSLFTEASLQALADQVWEKIKSMPRSIYSKYRELMSRCKAAVSKIQQARDDEEREEILNKEFSPSFQRLVSFLTSSAVAVVLYKMGLINPIVGIIGVVVTRLITNFQIKEKRKRALAILRNELNIAEESLEDARRDDNREAKIAIMKIRDKIKEMIGGISMNY